MSEPLDLRPDGPEGTPAGDAAPAGAAVPDPEPLERPADLTSVPTDPGDVSLLALVDRLAAVLDRSDLSELEVQVGGTGFVLRKPLAVVPVAVAAAPAGEAHPGASGGIC